MAESCVLALIQCRLSSKRFPAKGLASLHGKPIIEHVIERAAEVVGENKVAILTSDEDSDDPLAHYVRYFLEQFVFRGSLNNVFSRFRDLLQSMNHSSSDWFFRITADSPRLDPTLLNAMKAEIRDDLDFITIFAPPSWPHGTGAELIRIEAFLSIDEGELDDYDKEHVTPFLYRHSERFRTFNLHSGHPEWAERRCDVNTVDDLVRLEKLP